MYGKKCKQMHRVGQILMYTSDTIAAYKLFNRTCLHESSCAIVRQFTLLKAIPCCKPALQYTFGARHALCFP
jgi:hypothetical protein